MILNSYFYSWYYVSIVELVILVNNLWSWLHVLLLLAKRFTIVSLDMIIKLGTFPCPAKQTESPYVLHVHTVQPISKLMLASTDSRVNGSFSRAIYLHSHA